MNKQSRVLLINNIKLPVSASFEEAFSVAKKKLVSVGINSAGANFSVYKRSVDARNKSDIKFVYTVSASGEFPTPGARAKEKGISELLLSEKLSFLYGEERMTAPPLIVGSGPCGLFAALILAENGYNPVIVERGGSISERKKAVDRFYREHILDTDTNIQFGAGGAGTYSDGKLVTRINSPFCDYVMKRLVEFGAPPEILYIAKPHVGTEILSDIVDRILERIISLGGKVYYNTKFLGVSEKSGATFAKTDKGDIEYGALVLAIGHSARDTYERLFSDGFSVIPKSFSVGMRIEHLAEDIDKAMYGDFAGSKYLGHAEYNLSHNTKERGVYTFCMCPGGEVVAAASEELGVVVNGMSRHARADKNSNSAVVCSIFPEDYGNTPQAAIDFQREIERRAYNVGGGSYRAPIVTVGDFLLGKAAFEPTKVMPSYMKGTNVKIASPDGYLPPVVTASIRNALRDFDKKISGFAASYAVLTGAETRTSAPIRILRDDNTRLANGKSNIYPSGEGAGYAGGITSAAIDGIATATAIMKRFKRFDG